MQIQSFALIIGIGASLGLAWVAWHAPADRREEWVTAGLWVTVGALTGARLAYGAAHWEYYSYRLLEWLRIWEGGLSGAGAVAGGVVTIFALAAFRRINPGVLADGLLPLALMLGIGGWLGCWQAGCAYGPPGGASSLAAPSVDETGALALRFPLQWVAAVLLIGAFGLLERLRPALKHPGQLASLGVMALALVMGGVSMLRADPARLWLGLRVDLWAAMVLIILGGLWLVVASIIKLDERDAYEVNPGTRTNEY